MKDIIIKKLIPKFTTVLTTMDVYPEDLYANGVLVFPRGTLKLYQRVISVGDSVKCCKDGDLVLLNLQNYMVRKYKENSIKNDMDNMEETVTYNLPKLFIGGEIVGKFQDRDIEGVIADWEEAELDTGNPGKGIKGNKLL